MKKSFPFEEGSIPPVLNMQGDQSEILKRIENPEPERFVGPSTNYNELAKDFGPVGISSYTPNANGFTAQRADSVNDFSDILGIDKLLDKELAQLRKDGYRLSNIERELDIKHKHDFNSLVKTILIVFCICAALAFALIIGVISFTSYKSGSMTETGIIGNILQFIVDIVKIGLS